MEFGVHGLNSIAGHGPAQTARFARLAEQIGYRSWWAGDHVVLPRPAPPGAPMAPTDPIVDPLVHLGYVAALTERLELGTGVVILPQRNPLVLAKQAASLDVLSGGRLLLGVGAGFLEPEMTAVGVSMAERGARTDEYLDAMRSLWNDPAPAHRGRYTDFAGVDAHPRPVRPSGVRVVIGGSSPAAYRRAVTRGHGFYGNGQDPGDLARHLTGLKQAAAKAERPAHLGRLEVNFLSLAPALDRDTAERYAELGADRLVLYPPTLDDAGRVETFLRHHAGQLGLSGG